MDILGRRYYDMYKNKKCTDLTIKLKISEKEIELEEEIFIEVHKFVLASRSPVFEAMISVGTEKLINDGI